MVQAFRARSRGAAAGLTADRMQMLARQPRRGRARGDDDKLGRPTGRSRTRWTSCRRPSRRCGRTARSTTRPRCPSGPCTLMVRVQLDDGQGPARPARRARRAGPGDGAASRRGCERGAAVVRRGGGARPAARRSRPTCCRSRSTRRTAARRRPTALREGAAGVGRPAVPVVGAGRATSPRRQRLPRAAAGAGRRMDDWSSLLTIAELRLAEGDAAEARDAARAGIGAFEATVATSCATPIGWTPATSPTWSRSTPRWRWRNSRSATTLRPSTPRSPCAAWSPRSGRGGPRQQTWAAWQRAAAEYAAVSKTVLVGRRRGPRRRCLVRPPRRGRRSADGGRAGAGDRAARQPPAWRGLGPRPSASPSCSTRCPPASSCLAYLTVGDDFLAWAVTRDELVPHQRKHPRARARPTWCAASMRAAPTGGRSGRDAELSELVLGPFAERARSAPAGRRRPVRVAQPGAVPRASLRRGAAGPDPRGVLCRECRRRGRRGRPRRGGRPPRAARRRRPGLRPRAPTAPQAAARVTDRGG